MSMWRSVRDALTMLSKRDKRILLLLVAVQVFLSLFDLLGVALIGIVVLLSTSTLTGTEPSGLARQATDFIPGGSDPYSVTISLAVAAGLILVIKSVLSYLLTRRTFRFLANRQAMIAGDLAAGLLSRPLLDVQSRSSQDVATTLTRSVSQLTLGVLGGAVIFAAELSLLVFLIAGLLFVDVTVTIFSGLFFAAIALTVQRVLGHWASAIGQRSYQAQLGSLTVVQEAVKSYREISVAGRRSSYVDQFRAMRWRVASAESDLRLVNIVTKYIYEVALVIGGGLLAITQFVTKDATAAITVLAIFLASATRLLPSVMRLQTAAFAIRTGGSESAAAVRLHSELTGSVRATDEVSEVLAEKTQAGIENGHRGFDPRIAVKNCWLTYPGASSQALMRVSLEVPSGTSVALVGTTGAGKSTLADVILGVLAPDSGIVSVSDLSPSDAIRHWPGALAYVPQEVTIIEGSVRENIALGLPAELIDDALVWEALERAHLGSFLRTARNGIDTLVGESGVKLSGGQRQRLGLARALYTRPRLLVLDEATSALDAETEQLVTETVRTMEGEVTVVVIAHRLATIRRVDQVVYMSQGEIKAKGTFDEVLDQVPDFQRQAALLGLR